MNRAHTHRKLLVFRAECAGKPLPVAASWESATFGLVTCAHSQPEAPDVAALCGQKMLSH